MTKNSRVDHIISAVSYGWIIYMLTRVLWQTSTSLSWIQNNLEAIFIGEIFAVLLMMDFYDDELKVSRKWRIAISILMILLVAFLFGSFQVLFVLGALVVPKVLSGNSTRKSYILNYVIPFFIAVFLSSILKEALLSRGSFTLLNNDDQLGIAFLSLYYSILLIIELWSAIFCIRPHTYCTP